VPGMPRLGEPYQFPPRAPKRPAPRSQPLSPSAPTTTMQSPRRPSSQTTISTPPCRQARRAAGVFSTAIKDAPETPWHYWLSLSTQAGMVLGVVLLGLVRLAFLIGPEPTKNRNNQRRGQAASDVGDLFWERRSNCPEHRKRAPTILSSMRTPPKSRKLSLS